MRTLIVASCTLAAALVLLLGCQRSVPNAPDMSASPSGSTALQKAVGTTESTPPEASVKMLNRLNEMLKAKGQNYRVLVMEYITAPGSGQFGSTVFAKNVGNKQLAYHWVPALLINPGDLTYVVDVTEGAANGGLTNAESEPAIDRAMHTWDNVPGSGLTISKVNAPGLDLGIVQWLEGFGGAPEWVADITHAGWLSAAFFNAIAPPNGSTSIIGVTFTFIWVDDGGNPVDTNRDKKYDVAFREIYYNDYFSWTNEDVDYTSPLIDVETIALHEAGHGLSQAHFGMIFNDGKGTSEPGFQLQHLHFAPRAVMNAVYWETQRTLLGSDVAGHLSIWATWPAR